ncbi:isochorismate synthase [Pseudactinotalea sp. HY160]|uniref:isochorismate synthase n=1 Tax=Pseudactinotalea sp. HY160 TaxID=2654490 RepID=UPI00128D867F|nr:isochorismate synthase [Pseudactinotalea sp. HY160]MPV50494.1 isochorismate synthase [Pseudactinotalea sp. HY160]
MSAPSAAPLAPSPAYLARTVPIDDPGDLLRYLPAPTPGAALSWIRGGEGLVAWGEIARFRTTGPARFDDADDHWSEFMSRCVVRDEVGLPGTGPLAFGSFAFSADSPAGGVLIVPEVILGRRDGAAWLTVVTPGSLGPLPDLPAHLESVAPLTEATTAAFAAGARDEAAWLAEVGQVISAIRSGEVAKVVVARDLIATTTAPIDVRRTLGHLASAYATSWTFAVDGLIGATPELLLRRERGLLASRVLAGTIRRTGDADVDATHAAALAHSSKDLEEHEYAVDSLLESLRDHVATTSCPEVPFILQLPNVMHLATDVTAVPDADSTEVSSLAFAALLHPTAAVCGTPTAEAARVLAAHEGMDRDRYAGPVGWMGGDGDGEWAIALRTARAVTDRTWQLFAGCGIMAASDPAAEWAESEAKLAPMREAITAS